MDDQVEEASLAQPACELFTTRGFHGWRWIGWPLSITMSTMDGSRILEGTEAWCDVCGLRAIYNGSVWVV